MSLSYVLSLCVFYVVLLKLLCVVVLLGVSVICMFVFFWFG